MYHQIHQAIGIGYIFVHEFGFFSQNTETFRRTHFPATYFSDSSLHNGRQKCDFFKYAASADAAKSETKTETYWNSSKQAVTIRKLTETDNIPENWWQ